MCKNVLNVYNCTCHMLIAFGPTFVRYILPPGFNRWQIKDGNGVILYALALFFLIYILSNVRTVLSKKYVYVDWNVKNMYKKNRQTWAKEWRKRRRRRSSSE